MYTYVGAYERFAASNQVRLQSQQRHLGVVDTHSSLVDVLTATLYCTLSAYSTFTFALESHCDTAKIPTQIYDRTSLLTSRGLGFFDRV
jgi:hypothetical protein